MGNKVNPLVFRLGQNVGWSSTWFSQDKKVYRQRLLEDVKVRKFLTKKLNLAGIVKVEIRRSINKMNIILHVSRPGVVIGRGGMALEELKKELGRMISLPDPDKNLQLDVVEMKTPDLSAALVSRRLAEQLEKRMPYRRAVAASLEKVMAAGALGVKIILAGRVGGAEIGRTERFSQGKVPLQTIRARIDYDHTPALTKSGYVGVKVWIYLGE